MPREPVGSSFSPTRPNVARESGGGPRRWDWGGYAVAIAVVAVATVVGWPLHRIARVSDTNVLMFYLLGVLWVATRYSRGAATLASVLGVLAFDVTFVKPYYSLSVHDPQYLVTFGVMLLVALTISTLTHRVRARAEEARQAWERVEAEFLRNTLLSGVSHDLRTPLAAIVGAASILTEVGEKLSADARAEMLETIHGEAERMERLINNLLDMTRLESGGLVLKREWQPLAEIIGPALKHLERRLRGRGVTVELGAGLPMVQVDAVAIEQVIVNLVGNAIEYTPAESPIEISASGKGSGVVVEVADRGPGLPAGAEQRIFEKFFRSPAGERGGHGLGLGLAICRGIVEAHGGTISAGDRPGGGALFRFTLPVTGQAPNVDSSA